MRDDLTVREAGEVDEEPYDMLSRHPNHSPDVAVCVHEINSHDHVMTPGMKRTIGSVISCAVRAEGRSGAIRSNDPRR